MQVKKKPKKTAKAVPEKSRKKKQPGEGQIKKQPFLKRMLFGEEKPDLSELEAGSTTILDILSPTTVDTKSRDYIIVDDVYHAYLYITGYGYTTTVGTCWLAPLVEAGEGINLSFLVKRQPKEKILSKIAQTTMVNRSRMRDVGDTRQDYEELDSAISSGLYLKDVMNRQGENFYYMHTLIEVTAPDPETLEQRVTEVEKLCVSVDMIARRCDYKNEQAFLSALPILALDPDIERKARRNALTSGVAAAFPFVSYELSDHDGIFLGLNLYNRSPVFLNPYDDYKYTSGNWWIGGSTGAGKTVTLQCLGGRLREQGKRVIIIVPKKGHEFRPLCERLGGLYLRMSPSSKDCPNLMAIRRKSLDSYAKLKNIAARDDSVLADKIAQLIIWFSLKKKDLSEEDKSRLDSSLVEVYKRYGITFDNSTIVDENGNFRTMPILSDWYEILYQEQDTRHLAVVLSRYVTGSAAAMAGRNDIELNNKYIVLDLSGMPDDMIADGTFWATSIAYDLIMNCEDELSALLADELWSLVGATANPQAAGFVLEMVKTIRGLGGIAVTSTQGMQDLFSLEGGSYGKGILDSSRIKLVMQMEEQEARLIQDTLTPLQPWTADLSIISPDNACAIDKALLDDLKENPVVDLAYGRKFAYEVPSVTNGIEKKMDLISYEQYQFDWAKDYLLEGSLESVQTDLGTGLIVYNSQNTIQIGDTVSLNTNGQSKEIQIVGMLSDCPFYSAAGVGTIICSEDTFEQITGESKYTVIDVQLVKGTTDEDVYVIRQMVDSSFTFADERMGNSSTMGTYYCFWLFIYGFLVLIAMITIFNIINSISMSVSARLKQYGAFRAIGVSMGQLSKMIVAEAFTYTIIGGVVGTVLGLFCNKLLFGMLISYRWGDAWTPPLPEVAVILLIVVSSVILAVHGPIKRIRNMSIVDTISAQ